FQSKVRSFQTTLTHVTAGDGRTPSIGHIFRTAKTIEVSGLVVVLPVEGKLRQVSGGIVVGRKVTVKLLVGLLGKISIEIPQRQEAPIPVGDSGFDPEIISYPHVEHIVCIV